MKRLQEPGVDICRQTLQFSLRGARRIDTFWRRKPLAPKVIRTLDKLDAVVDRKPVESLNESIGPAHCRAHKVSRIPHAEEKLLCVLGEKSRSRLKIFRLTATLRFNRH